jgi:uncharacterized LabA/DUF88 family protein
MVMNPTERVFAYIDGYNLYYGLKSKGWKKFYWLNIQAMAVDLLKPHQILIRTKYFTTIIKRPRGKHDRQNEFLEALQTCSDFDIFYGHFLSSLVTCHNCGHSYYMHHEKMTDVNIAVELLIDSFNDRFDIALLISADSDLIGPVRAIKSAFPAKKVIIAFPPNRVSEALKREADGFIFISRNTIAKCQFPTQITKPDGFTLRKPTSWC